MKRSARLERRTSLRRSGRLRPYARRRRRLSKAEHRNLKDLHREVVMLRAGAERRQVGNRRLWFGRCEWCGRYLHLSCCHIHSVGSAPAMEFEPDNAWAGCHGCHIYRAHRSPRAARAFIVAKLGEAKVVALERRASTEERPDYGALRVRLERERDQLRQVQGGTDGGD